MFRPVQFRGDVNVIHEALDIERQVWGVGTHQLFQLFTLLVEAHQGPRLGFDIQLVLLGKFLTKVFHQYLVKILPTQLRVARCGEDLREIGKKAVGVTRKPCRLDYFSVNKEKWKIKNTWECCAHLEFPLIKGTHWRLVSRMAEVHKHNIPGFLLRSREILLVDSIRQSNCEGNC